MTNTVFSPSNQNFLSPIGFKFIIGRTPNVDYFCQSASIPNVEIGVREIQTPVKDYSLPGDKMTFGDLNLTFLINENMDNYYEIYKWMKGLSNPKEEEEFFNYLAGVKKEVGRQEPFRKATTDARLLVLDSNFNTITTTVFMDVFPVSLSGVRFSADPTDIDYVTADVTFQYTLLEFEDNDGNKV